jgi:peptide/nickel transport system permease protein
MTTASISTETARAPGGSRAWRKLWQDRKAWLGCAIVMVLLLCAAGANLIAPYRENQVFWDDAIDGGDKILAAPTWRHPLGLDANGYDVFSRVLYGSRLSLLAGGISILLAISIGWSAGLAAGYFGGAVDSLIMRTIDIVLSFPGILIAFLVLLALPRGWTPVIIAVGLINVPIFARQVRATVLTVRELDYVTAARAVGGGNRYILWRVIAPACFNPVIVLATLGLGSAILEVAGLSFLGIGGNAGDPEWGAMLNDAKNHLNTSIWPAIGPGVAISLSVLGFNLIGDALRDAFDPRLKA